METVNINRPIPKELHKKCQYKALELNITLHELYIEAIRQFVNGKEEPK